MPLVTVPVTFDLGPSKSGALIVAALGTKDNSATELICSQIWSARADSLGRGVLNLWSNAALANGSTYNVAISHESGDQLRTGGTVPNAPSCTLDAMFNPTPAGALAIAAGALAITDGYLVLGA